MFLKDDILTIDIVDMSRDGDGIGKIDGFVVFVRGALLGDRVKARLIKVKKAFAIGELLEIIEFSKDRINSPCNINRDCGGCSMIDLSYDKQLYIKEQYVNNTIERIAKISDFNRLPIVSLEDNIYHYRNKATASISTGGNIMRKGGMIESVGEPKVGFYRRKTHEVIDSSKCLIQSEAYKVVADAIRAFMKSDNITAWDPKWEQGLFRNVVVKTGFVTKEVMIILVINGKKIPNGVKLLGMLDDELYKAGFSLESVYINIKKDKVKNGEIMGDKQELYAGKPVIVDYIGDVKYEISSKSFYQVNPLMTRKLYDAIKDIADLDENDIVLDLYSGVGSIGIYVVGSGCKVVGIEYVKEAVLDANRNAVINGFVDCRYVCGKVEDVLFNSFEEADNDGVKIDEDVLGWIKNANVAIIDPPRSGMDKKAIDTIVKIGVDKIVYVSCDPATLARDIAEFNKYGYKLETVQAFDMYPNTTEVEVVTQLIRSEATR
ncbi:MAG: 23S rRNA (uracil(1939)-C(5))-methyltransferase RlmD [Eubacteriales bacterium]|nr:23S rRNA (uracil(1939)-C(5))-methyltransferase RlmD [Eubacteriales bacterium]MDY3333293.1 23S rRNA (uracil(1939)-C(5))-methyltransferase RlmD [Gallibacter sp.]